MIYHCANCDEEIDDDASVCPSCEEMTVPLAECETCGVASEDVRDDDDRGVCPQCEADRESMPTGDYQ